MVPRVQWSPELDISAMYARIQDIFVTCFIGEKRVLGFPCGDRRHFIRDAFTDA
ncbi:hypothetical protein AZE42_09160 [Rhizopogon vesiculosus]|uniref:Uncharacterized protein n=1 Tax=Rhizopogon vesiculosus TaxID=180088 RepID=A0A1J8PRX3_9AGAM|nr:hypothetical protein AZE42_09160 [Rhizopogon vesiculosus]